MFGFLQQAGWDTTASASEVIRRRSWILWIWVQCDCGYAEARPRLLRCASVKSPFCGPDLNRNLHLDQSALNPTSNPPAPTTLSVFIPARDTGSPDLRVVWRMRARMHR